jgi:predicted membrane protein
MLRTCLMFRAVVLSCSVQLLTGVCVYASPPSTLGTYTEFDVPGALNTNPTSIDLEGAITGSYSDADGNVGAFVRGVTGAITKFNVPGGTFPSPTSINLAGAITGSYTDSNGIGEGFVRARSGAITTFNIPGSVLTAPQAISLNGEVAGYYFDANFVGHGFFRTRSGSLTTFDAPGAGASTTIFPQGTFTLGIGGFGATAGAYYDANGNSSGFLLAKNGTFTSFSAPGNIVASAPFSFGKSMYINPQGVIAGTYFQPIAGNPFGGDYQVFIRDWLERLPHLLPLPLPRAAYGRSSPGLTLRTRSWGRTTTPIPSITVS